MPKTHNACQEIAVCDIASDPSAEHEDVCPRTVVSTVADSVPDSTFAGECR